MNRALGLVLALAGGAVAVACIVLALRELGGLYNGTIADPLGQAESAEANASRQMLIYAAVGAAGVVPMILGVFMLKSAGRR